MQELSREQKNKKLKKKNADILNDRIEIQFNFYESSFFFFGFCFFILKKSEKKTGCRKLGVVSLEKN